MRKNRIIVFGLWCLSLVGISFYGGAITYSFFWAMTFLPLLSLIYLLCVYWRFRIYQKIEAKTLVCDQPVPFYFTLQNEVFFAFAGVRVHFFAPLSSVTGIDDGVEYELMPKTGISKETNLICRYRGEYEVGVRRLEFTDFFRLFHISFRNSETLKVRVRPKITILESLGELEEAVSEKELQGAKQEPDVLSREYVPGDDVRRMNWKATARYQKPMIRQLKGTKQQGISIAFSTFRASEDLLSYLPLENKVLELSLALTRYYCEHQIPVNVLYQGEMTEDGCEIRNHVVEQPEQFQEVYDGLSESVFDREKTENLLMESLSRRGELFESRMVYLVVENWDAAGYRLAEQLNDEQVPVVVCLVSRMQTAEEEPEHPALTRVLRLSCEDDLKEVFR